MNLKRVFSLTFWIFFVFNLGNCFAYSEVKVDGLFRFSKDSVVGALKFKNQKNLSEEELSEEIKNLYALGFFSDIKLNYENDILKIAVVEVPVVADVKFNGLKAFKKNVILQELSTQNRSFYSKANVIADAQKIETAYKSLGILDATVEPMIEFLDGGKVFVVFNIEEGQSRKVNKIFINGNKAFSDYNLREQLFTKEDNILRILSGRTKYNVSATISDVERLKFYYKQKGYIDVDIDYQIITLNDNNTVDINIFLNEGEKFNFGDYQIQNNLPNFIIHNPKSLIKFKKNSLYNVQLVQLTQYEIQKALNKDGFLFSEVDVSYKKDYENRTAKVIFTINPSKRIFVNKIKIAGNLKTNDNVIRREFDFVEGDVYNAQMIARATQKLRNTGYFEDVNIKEEKVGSDRIDLLVEVKEGRTVVASTQLAYDFESGVSASVSLEESNLMGMGMPTSISIEKGRFNEGVAFSITDPYFLNRPLSLSSSTGYNNNYNTNFKSYKSKSVYQIITASYSISDYLSHSLTYQIKRDALSVVDNGEKSISPTLAEQEGIFITSAIGQTLSYDKRDIRFLPNNGYLIQISQTLAGIGGNVKYIKHEVRLEKYFEVFNIEDSVIGFKVKAMNINGIWGEQVGIKDRVNLGGNNGLRGFDFSGVGPKLQIAGEVDTIYGGKNLLAGTLEYRFPNFLPKEFRLNTFIFFDFGTVFGYDDLLTKTVKKYQIIDSNSIRTSAGIGLSIQSPFGLISISYAKALKYQEFDERKRFFLNIGGISF